MVCPLMKEAPGLARKTDGGRDIRRGTDSAERREFATRSRRSRIFLACAFGFDRAGRDAVYPDSVLPEFDRRFFGEHFNSAFARGVGDERGERKFVAARTEIHDRSSAVVFHAARRLLGTQEAAFQIGVDDQVPFFLGYLEERLPGLHAGVVDQQVEVAEFRDHLLEHGRDLSAGADVSLNAN